MFENMGGYQILNHLNGGEVYVWGYSCFQTATLLNILLGEDVNYTEHVLEFYSLHMYA